MQQLLGIDNQALERRLAVKDYIFDEKNDHFYPNDEYNTVFILRAYAAVLQRPSSRSGFRFPERRAQGSRYQTAHGWQCLDGRYPDGRGFIEIRITQRKIRDGKPSEYFLEIKHDGIIVFDVMGD